MQANIPPRRYWMDDYGGRLFTDTQRTIARNVMYVRGLVNQIEGTRFP
jgi:hypothetical protein